MDEKARLLDEQAARTSQLRDVTAVRRDVIIDGITLVIDPDVFPPDIGYSSRMTATALEPRVKESALDMGTGSLYLALYCRKLGVPRVWASDLHPASIQCARRNLEVNPGLAPITIVESDLFEKIPREQHFDTIIFNQPFYPILDGSVAGLGQDGGRPIISRFLRDAHFYLEPGGEVIMSSSSIASQEDSPLTIATEMGWTPNVLLTAGQDGLVHRIVALQPAI